jgi:3-hydroxyacyl-CoA dehydrogenase
MQSVTTEQQGDILVVTVNNPPVNALSWHVRDGIGDAMEAAMKDDSVKAVVLRCDGRTFIAGADISELGGPPKFKRDFATDLMAMETGPKPIIAAIHGTALGGGLETALCCHYRIAVPSTKLGLPEVNLGLLPGGGGTQRLPRVVGIEQAAVMVALGAPVSAKKALEIGLIDALASEDSLAADAVKLAQECIAKGPRPTRNLEVKGDLGVIARLEAENARKWKGFDAPYANLRCIAAAAANPDIDKGLAVEREEFLNLLNGSQSAAQRHMFFAERQAAKIDGLPKDVALRPIKKVGVIGAGTMGGGITMNFLSAGIPVTIVEMAQEALDRGVGVIRKNYEASAAKGRFTQEKVEAMMGILTPSLSFDDLADCRPGDRGRL